MVHHMSNILDQLMRRQPNLLLRRENIVSAFEICKKGFDLDHTLFVCGNGGSAADAEHIVGELLKGFLKKRRVSSEMRTALVDAYGDDGKKMADRLQGGLRAISLTSHVSFSTAFANDEEPSLVFAQQLFALGRKGDVLLAISTSGNSKNVVDCIKIAKIMGIPTIAMTGESGGECGRLADCVIAAPSTETFIIQEYHVQIYHALCAMIEECYYDE